MTLPGDWKIVVGRRGKVRGMPGLGAAGQGGGEEVVLALAKVVGDLGFLVVVLIPN